MEHTLQPSPVSVGSALLSARSAAAELARGRDVSIVNLVSSIVEEAYHSRSSDIHMNPNEKGLRIRMRIDGVLSDRYLCEKRIHNEIIARIKVLAGLRTDEHQAAQDGRFRIMVDDTPLDVRVSITPTYYGENAVLRLLGNKSERHTLETLGFSEKDQKHIQHAIRRPHGMILATGPTGSGKTTTLYTLLSMLSTPEVSIITIEDPVEYAMEGITQIQVNPRTGITFGSGLRSILRQDPNVIMVGEIRDAETASIAVNTALTGHLLLSTLHTNDAATTLPRLLDMGIDAYLVASTVNIAIGQRLIRRICPDCKVEHALSDAEEESLRETLPEGTPHHAVFFEGKGCDTCGGSGYKGRTGVNEVLVVDQEIREAILRRAPASAIRDIAIKNGMVPMFQEGFNKAMRGETTVAEVLRNLIAE